MHTLRNLFYYILILVATVLIFLSMLSLVHDVADWYTKVLDFPRTQYMIAGIVCVFLFVVMNRRWNWYATALMLGLGASIAVQALFIWPYLLGSQAVPLAERSPADEERSVSIMLANVLITNDSTDALLRIVRKWDPDLLLTVEVNDRWVEQLSTLEQDYPYTVKYPTDNAYGMAFYSRFPLSDTDLKFYHEHQDVPALVTRVTLPSGRDFMFYGAHPVAPVPSNRWPDGTGEKEKALVRIGRLVAQDDIPAIVAGDFNDVSWSNTARLFEQEGHLNNVRIGRGLYNTFDANSPVLRWPLDHYFVSDDFALLRLERLPGFGSDHFPMYADFVLR